MNTDIRFVDSRENTLFTVPDGGNIVVTEFDGDKLILPCRYLDETLSEIGGTVFNIRKFAGIMEQAGSVYAPEIVKPGDCIDTYEIYQIKNTRDVNYCFRSFAEAEKQINRDDYLRVYAGMFTPHTTMEFLYAKHNRDNRPFGKRMRSLSISDVIVLNRAGKQQAFYVDTFRYEEVPVFLRPEPEKNSPHKAVKKRGREYER